MPELPEVETVRIGLASQLIGEVVVSIEVLMPKVFKGDSTKITGARILNVQRRSKLLIFNFDSGYSLAVHLKMTGRLIVEGSNNKLRDNWEFDYQTHKHTHAKIRFKSGKSLLFHDVRQFGYLELIKSNEIEQLPYVKNLGKEFLTSLTELDFLKILAESKRVIKTVLLDQTKVAGVGNIYANEALYLAKIHPESLAHKIPQKKASDLFVALEKVMQQAILAGGASSNDFRDAFGKKGQAQNAFVVYGKTGSQCYTCGSLITKKVVGGRGTYICECCQPKHG